MIHTVLVKRQMGICLRFETPSRLRKGRALRPGEGPFARLSNDLSRFERPNSAATASDFPAARGGVDCLLVNSHLPIALGQWDELDGSYTGRRRRNMC